jgi:hypothetical protein
MALAAVTSGSNATALSVQQIINLLTGVMTDQPTYIANTIRASTTGATTAAYFAGGTASGAPASGAHSTGEFIVDITGTFWICTAGGTPGTWKQAGAVDTTAGDYLGLVAAGAAAVAGSTGKAADAGHQHPAFVNAAGGFVGNLFQGQLSGVDKFKVDQTGLMTIAGRLSATGVDVTGTISGVTTLTATTLAGTLSTAAQPNVTSLGTIAALVATKLNLGADATNTVQTLGNSVTGSKHFIQSTDPAGLAANGDTWDNA